MKVTHILSIAAVLSIGLVAHADEVSTETIAKTWTSYGQGVVRYQNRMLFIQEAEETKGVGVVSPKAYGANVVLRYELMAMNPASVCVAVLSASDDGEQSKLTVPKDYDGGLGLWTRDSHNYFFAFHNMAHDRTPFVNRFPAGRQIAEQKENVMQAGVFYTIEVGRDGGKLWMSVDGKRVMEGEDAEPLGGGHVGFRIRGINGQAAACLIRNVSIVENK
jgi:hypothetical protein